MRRDCWPHEFVRLECRIWNVPRPLDKEGVLNHKWNNQQSVVADSCQPQLPNGQCGGSQCWLWLELFHQSSKYFVPSEGTKCFDNVCPFPFPPTRARNATFFACESSFSEGRQCFNSSAKEPKLRWINLKMSPRIIKDHTAVPRYS